MNTLTLPGTDLTVSSISYGTAELGVRMSDAEVATLIDVYRDAGGNFIDTAHVYAFWTSAGAGSSECAISRYRKARGGGDLIVATKGGHPPAPGYRSVERWLDPCRVRSDIEDSLGRLEVETIDLYYLHRDDTRFGVEEIIEMMNDFIGQGLIRHIGASNWTRSRLQAANEYAAATGRHGFVVAQDQFSLAQKETPAPMPHGEQGVYIQSDDIEFHTRTGLPLCAYTSTAQGYFSSDDGTPHGTDSPVNRTRRARAVALAADKSCTPTQIALAWLMHQPFPCIPITGTRSPAHLKENLKAAGVSLSDDDLGRLAGA